MHKKVKGLLPTVIANYFNTETRSEHGYNLRPRQNGRTVFESNTAVGRKSIQYGGQILWRDLPQYLKDIGSSITFKKYLKAYLLGSD